MSLRTVARMSGRDIIISTGAVEGKIAPELRGTYLPDEAVRKLTAESGVRVRFTRDAVLVGGDAQTNLSEPRPIDSPS